MKNLTDFQSSITKEILIEICRKMHFTLSDEQLSNLQFYFQYTWVCVEFRVKGYGYVSFGINNHESFLSGNKVNKAQVQNSLNNGGINCKIWRFAADEIYKREKEAKDMIKLFKKPTVEEFLNNYYSD